jgi:protein-disulfide isomerase
MLRFAFVWSFLMLVNLPATAGSPKGDGFPWDRVEGIKASEFKEDFLVKVSAALEKIPSYGRCTESIAACLRKDPPHNTAVRLARDVLLLMSQGIEESKVLEWVGARKLMAHPEDLRSFNLENLKPLGKEDARVTIVEFSDFQCPFCARVAPTLENVVRESKGKARLFFKQFPIKGHPRALQAAKACVAADKFGKFWEYCASLFLNRLDLSDEKFIQLASQYDIDPEKFKQEMKREAVVNRIADEKMEGLRCRVKGTPTVFINGKEMLLEPTPSMIRDRIEEELDILNGRD